MFSYTFDFQRVRDEWRKRLRDACLRVKEH